MDAPRQLCSRIFPCDCLAERSHLAEGEQGDVRNQALSGCSSRPKSRSLMLPWQTALATWLLTPLFLVSGSFRGSVVLRTLGRALPWLLGAEGGLAFMLLASHTAAPAQSICNPPCMAFRSTLLARALEIPNAYPSERPSRCQMLECVCDHSSVPPVTNAETHKLNSGLIFSYILQQQW